MTNYVQNSIKNVLSNVIPIADEIIGYTQS